VVVWSNRAEHLTGQRRAQTFPIVRRYLGHALTYGYFGVVQTINDLGRVYGKLYQDQEKKSN
jgi:hypothetical protein